MRDDHLKRHMNSKHNNVSSTQDRGEELSQNVNIIVNGQYKADDENETETETFKVEESGNLLVSCSAKLEFELQRDNEVYKKNVEIGERISVILHRGIILEKSLSKQNKFCLDLFRAQKPTINVENTNILLWKEQLLEMIDR